MIVHLDADAFFASVEQAADPKLRGKPVAVGGDRRGIIASASYEARKLGIYAPMPTYVSGKNKWGFKFNRTHDYQPSEFAGLPLTRGMDSVSTNGCASPWVQSNRGMAGLDEAVSFRAYELAGVPASRCRHVQFRVIDAAEEQTTKQYTGDLWGLHLLVENPDGGFLDERELPDWKLHRTKSVAFLIGEPTATATISAAPPTGAGR